MPFYLFFNHRAEGKRVGCLTLNVLCCRVTVIVLFFVLVLPQSDLPRPIQRNSVESDNGCISRIYFDNAGDNVTLTLYNVTLTSQKPCLHNNKCDCSKTIGLNEDYVFFFNKISL